MTCACACLHGLGSGCEGNVGIEEVVVLPIEDDSGCSVPFQKELWRLLVLSSSNVKLLGLRVELGSNFNFPIQILVYQGMRFS